MKARIHSIFIAAAVLGLASPSSHAAILQVGTQFGIDYGATATQTTNWNNFSALGTIGAGSVVDLVGTSIDGVSIALSSPVATFWGGNYPNWPGLSTQGGLAPAEFVNSVTMDFGGFGSAPGGLTTTITGLNPNFFYDVYGVTQATDATNRVDTLTITGDAIYGPSPLLRATSAAGAFHTFAGIRPDATGTLIITLTDAGGFNNAVINGLLINAVGLVPEPSTAALLTLALGAIGLRRRR